MVITWYGQSCFRIQSGDLVLITDPFSKEIGLKPPAGQADIITISHEHYDHNNRGAVKGNPFIIDSPGEYSLKGISVIGIPSRHETEKAQGSGPNTIYVIEMEDMRICHLGDQGKKLSNEQLEQIGDVDTLLIPIGGTYTLNAEEALDTISQIEPRIIIPMHYKINGLNINLDTVDKFAKEIGVKKENINVPKITLKKKTLPEGDNEVYIMEPLSK